MLLPPETVVCSEQCPLCPSCKKDLGSPMENTHCHCPLTSALPSKSHVMDIIQTSVIWGPLALYFWNKSYYTAPWKKKKKKRGRADIKGPGTPASKGAPFKVLKSRKTKHFRLKNKLPCLWARTRTHTHRCIHENISSKCSGQERVTCPCFQTQRGVVGEEGQTRRKPELAEQGSFQLMGSNTGRKGTL